MSEEMSFDLLRREVPVTIDGNKFVLREATADAACKWRNALMKSSRLTNGEVVMTADGLADAEPVLVAHCLFLVGKDGVVTGNHVHENVVRGWPARVVKSLYEKAMEISQLGGKAEEADVVKNEPAATQGISG